MRLDIGRVLTHDNYTLEFDCGEDFSARETMDGSRPFAEVRVRGTVRMRYDGIRLQANIEAPCVASISASGELNTRSILYASNNSCRSLNCRRR